MLFGGLIWHLYCQKCDMGRVVKGIVLQWVFSNRLREHIIGVSGKKRRKGVFIICIFIEISRSVVSRHPFRPVSSRPDFLVPSRDFPIGIESEGNGRDKNL